MLREVRSSITAISALLVVFSSIAFPATASAASADQVKGVVMASENTVTLTVTNNASQEYGVSCFFIGYMTNDDRQETVLSANGIIAKGTTGTLTATGPDGQIGIVWMCAAPEGDTQSNYVWGNYGAICGTEKYCVNDGVTYYIVGDPITVTLPYIQTPGTIINGINVGTPTNAKHRWGKCTVQDFNGGPNGHVIVDYTYGTHIVRNGMLKGWRASGGAPKIGCAKSDEFMYWGNSLHQTFDKEGLYWVNGMSRAKIFQPTCLWAIRWPSTSITWSYGGDHRYLGNARKAAENWSKATGLSITEAPAGQAGNIRFEDYYDENEEKPKYAEVMYPDEWKGWRADETTTSFRSSPTVTVRVNQYNMDKFWHEGIKESQFDYARTFILTHEVGHALGAAHTDKCKVGKPKSIMYSGDKGTSQYRRQFLQGFNTPQAFDIAEIRQLYGLPA